MKKNELLGGKYFNADDVRERDLTLLIEEVVQEEFKEEDGYKKKKTVIHFRGVEKKLACGPEKLNILFEMFGDDSDTDDWVGQRIRLYLGKTTFAGKRVDCVSVAAPKPPKARAAAPVPVAPAADDDEDPDVPF